jgi:hypothetical protein
MSITPSLFQSFFLEGRLYSHYLWLIATALYFAPATNSVFVV